MPSIPAIFIDRKAFCQIAFSKPWQIVTLTAAFSESSVCLVWAASSAVNLAAAGHLFGCDFEQSCSSRIAVLCAALICTLQAAAAHPIRT